MNLKTHQLTKLICVMCLFIGLTQVGCRKTDAVIEKVNMKDPVDPASDPLVKKVKEEFQKREMDAGFRNQFNSRYGNPLWEHALIIPERPEVEQGKTSNKETTVIIPVLRQDDDQIRSYIEAKVGTNVELSIQTESKYRSLSFSNRKTKVNEAEKHAVRMMILNKKVFNHSKFNITDKRLFHGSDDFSDTTDITRTVTLSDNNRNARMYYVEICVTITTTYNHCPYPGNCTGGGGSCDGCTEVCTSSTSSTTCEGWWEDDGGGGGGGTGGGDTGGGGGGGGTGGGGDPDPCNGSGSIPVARALPCDGDGGGGGIDPEPIEDEPYATLSQQLNAILQPGDNYTFVSHPDPSQCLSFNSVAEFQNYLQNNANNQQADLSTPTEEINQTQKFEHAKFNLTFIGGVDVKCKLEKVNNVWNLINVTSTDYGVTLGWEWEQNDYSQSTAGNEITVVVKGEVQYNIIIDGVGVWYEQPYTFQIKINKTTGKITSLAKL